MALVRAMRSRLAAIIAVRLIVTSLLLGSGVAIGLTTPDTLPAVPFVVSDRADLRAQLLYLATLRLALKLPVLVDLQFAIDAALVSACIYITGGIASDFSSLYVLPIIAASTGAGPPRRLPDRGPECDAVRRHRFVAVPRRGAGRGAMAAGTRGAAGGTHRPVHGGRQSWRHVRGRHAVGVAGGAPAVGASRAAGRVVRDCRSSRLQRARHRRTAGRPDHH